MFTAATTGNGVCGGDGGCGGCGTVVVSMVVVMDVG